MGKVIIRTFEASDIQNVALLMVKAFKSKFVSLHDMEDWEALQLFIDLAIVYPDSFDGYHVAEYKGQVIGVLVMKWKCQEGSARKRKEPIFTLCKKYGFFKVIHVLMAKMILEERVETQDSYIESLAVHPDFRSQGVGRQLLDYGFSLCRSIPHIDRITLHVAAKNNRAKKLYEQLGFRVVERVDSLLATVLLRHGQWYYMAKDLDAI